MADLLIEVYEVCYGTGVDDPAPQVVSLPYRTKAGAVTAAAALNVQARAGGFDPASTDPAKAFFIRTRAGQQRLASTPAERAPKVPHWTDRMPVWLLSSWPARRTRSSTASSSTWCTTLFCRTARTSTGNPNRRS